MKLSRSKNFRFTDHYNKYLNAYCFHRGVGDLEVRTENLKEDKSPTISASYFILHTRNLLNILLLAAQIVNYNLFALHSQGHMDHI